MGEGTPGAEPDGVWRQYRHTCSHFVAASADGATGPGCRAGASLAAATDAAGHRACFAGPGAPLRCGVACPLAAYPAEAQARAAAAASAAHTRLPRRRPGGPLPAPSASGPVPPGGAQRLRRAVRVPPLPGHAAGR